MARRRLAATLLFIATLVPSPGRAEPLAPGATLTVRNPPSMPDCVEEAALAARIRNQLSRRATTDFSRLPTAFDITIQRTLTTLMAELHVTGKSTGTREIEAARCPGLTEALAVTVLMILDENADSRGSARDGAIPSGQSHPTLESPAPTSASSDVTASETPRTEGHARTTPRRFPPAPSAPKPLLEELRASVAGGVGTRRRFHFEVVGEIGWHRWGFGLGAYYQPPSHLELGNGTLTLTTVGGLAAGCYRLGTRVRLVPCLRSQLGAERVSATGFDHTRTKWLMAASLGPTLGLETGARWVAGLDVMGQLSWWRDTYVVDHLSDTANPPLFVVWLVARVTLSSTSGARRTE